MRLSGRCTFVSVFGNRRFIITTNVEFTEGCGMKRL